MEEKPPEEATARLRVVSKPCGVFRACYVAQKSYVTLRLTGVDKDPLMASVDEKTAKRYGLVHANVIYNIMTALEDRNVPEGVKDWILDLRRKI